MTDIVVSRRDGILRAPDGTKHRVARGKTLAEADHPAVLANPQDWVPMVVTLTVDDRPALPEAELVQLGTGDRLVQLENDLAELEETLAQRDAELTRLAEGLAELGVRLPAEDGREPGWLVDLALDAVVDAQATHFREGGVIKAPFEPVGEAPRSPAPSIAPPKARKRTAPPLVTRTGDDG